MDSIQHELYHWLDLVWFPRGSRRKGVGGFHQGLGQFFLTQRSAEELDCRFSLTVTHWLYMVKIQLYKIQSDSETKINKNLPIYSIEDILHFAVCNRLFTDRKFYVQKKAAVDVSCVSPGNINGTVKCGTDPDCNIPRQTLHPYVTDQYITLRDFHC